MRTRTAFWFECKVRYDKVMENGLQKKVTENYVVNALSYGDAEARMTEQAEAIISSQFDVIDVKKMGYKEVFFDDENPNADRWYRAKLMFITIDEKTEKEKRSAVAYLVQGSSLNNALENIKKVMDGTLIDYEASLLSETKLSEVFECS